MTSFASILAQADVDIETLDAALGDGRLSGWDWLRAGAIILGGLVVGRIIRWIVYRVASRASDAGVAALVARVAGIAVVTVALVYSLETLGVRIAPLLGALGIVGIALAFALKDILENFVAGLLLQFRRPFTYGDEIVSGDVEGRVTAIDARSVTVETPDGETIHVPSSKVITDAIVNHSARGRRRTSLPIGVAYGTDLRRARERLSDAVRDVPEVHRDPAPEVLVTGFGDSSIDLVIRFWHDASIADHWLAQSEVALALEKACADHDIEIPFPQRVVWTGAPSTRANRATTIGAESNGHRN